MGRATWGPKGYWVYFRGINMCVKEGEPVNVISLHFQRRLNNFYPKG